MYANILEDTDVQTDLSKSASSKKSDNPSISDPKQLLPVPDVFEVGGLSFDTIESQKTTFGGGSPVFTHTDDSRTDNELEGLPGICQSSLCFLYNQNLTAFNLVGLILYHKTFWVENQFLIFVEIIDFCHMNF